MAKSDRGVSSLDIKKVGEGASLDDFLSVPEKVYAGDPVWIAPLRLERKMHLSAKQNPIFQFCEVALWVAYRDGKPVGRISAQVNRLHLETHQDASGQFGLFECIEDQEVCSLLLSTAASWLKTQGMKRMTGPFSLSINEESGLLVEGFDTPPMFLMPHGRPYYDRLVQQSGLESAQDLLAYRFKTGTEALPPAARRMVERLEKDPAISFRALDKKNIARDIQAVLKIFNDGWCDNWGFIPFTEAEAAKMAGDLKMVLKPDYLSIVEKDGEPVAFALLLPNLNEAFAGLKGRLLPFGWALLAVRLLRGRFKTARLPLMGVAKRYQGTLIGAAYAYAVIDRIAKAGVAHGLEWAELSWVLESNKDTRTIIEPLTGPAYKRYRIYQMEL